MRNHAFGLVAEIDDDVFAGDAEDGALQDFVGGRRREMAVIFEQMLVILGTDGPLARCFGLRPLSLHRITNSQGSEMRAVRVENRESETMRQNHSKPLMRSVC